MKTIILLIFLTFSHFVHAKGKVAVNFFMGSSSRTVYKGALTWNGKGLMLGPGLIFFGKLAVNGPSLSYSVFNRENAHALKFSARIYDDEEPMIKLDDTKRSFRNSRPDSIPLDFSYRYRFGYRKKFYIGAKIEKEVAEHKGHSFELHLGTPLLPFTSFNFVQAFSSDEANRYFYGHETDGGASYTKVGIGLFFPFVPFGGKMQASYDKYIINKGASRNANLVRGAYNNDVAVLRFFWKVY